MNLARSPLHCSFLLKPSPYSHNRLCRTVSASSNGENNTTTNPEETPPLNTSTTTTNQSKKKLKVKSRRRSRDEKEERLLEMAASSPGRMEKETKKKRWEEMTLAEKALELYLGEMGGDALLFEQIRVCFNLHYHWRLDFVSFCGPSTGTVPAQLGASSTFRFVH